jgi:hypothetical protein
MSEAVRTILQAHAEAARESMPEADAGSSGISGIRR